MPLWSMRKSARTVWLRGCMSGLALMDGGEGAERPVLTSLSSAIAYNAAMRIPRAVALAPRLLLTERKMARTLNEAEPFNCISCGKVLGTRQIVDGPCWLRRAFDVRRRRIESACKCAPIAASWTPTMSGGMKSPSSGKSDAVNAAAESAAQAIAPITRVARRPEDQVRAGLPRFAGGVVLWPAPTPRLMQVVVRHLQRAKSELACVVARIGRSIR